MSYEIFTSSKGHRSSHVPRRRRRREAVAPCFDLDDLAHFKNQLFVRTEYLAPPSSSSDCPIDLSACASDVAAVTDSLNPTTLGISVPTTGTFVEEYIQFVKTPDYCMNRFATSFFEGGHANLYKSFPKFHLRIMTQVKSLIQTHPTESCKALGERLEKFIAEIISSDISQAILDHQPSSTCASIGSLKGFRKFQWFTRQEVRDILLMNASGITSCQRPLQTVENEIVLETYQQALKTHFIGTRLKCFAFRCVEDFVRDIQRSTSTQLLKVECTLPNSNQNRTDIPVPGDFGPNQVYRERYPSQCVWNCAGLPAEESVVSNEQAVCAFETQVTIKFDKDYIPIEKLLEDDLTINGCVTVRTPKELPAFDQGCDVDLVIIFEVPKASDVPIHVYSRAFSECFLHALRANVHVVLVHPHEHVDPLLCDAHSLAHALRRMKPFGFDFDRAICKDMAAAIDSACVWLKRDGKRRYQNVFMVGKFEAEEDFASALQFDKLDSDLTIFTFVPGGFRFVAAEEFAMRLASNYGGQIHVFELWCDLASVFSLAIAQEVVGIRHRKVRVSLQDVENEFRDILVRSQSSNADRTAMTHGDVLVNLEVTNAPERSKLFHINRSPYPCHSQPCEDKTIELTNIAYGSKRDVMFKLVLKWKRRENNTSSATSDVESEHVQSCASSSEPTEHGQANCICKDDVDLCKYCLCEDVPRQIRCTRIDSKCRFAICNDCATDDVFEALRASGQIKCLNCNLMAKMFKSQGVVLGDDVSLRVPVSVSASEVLPKGSAGRVVEAPSGNSMHVLFHCGTGEGDVVPDISCDATYEDDDLLVGTELNDVFQDDFEVNDVSSTVVEDEEGLATVKIVSRKGYMSERRLGIMYKSVDDLTLVGVEDNSLFSHTSLRNYADDGWRISHLFGCIVRTKKDIRWVKDSFIKDGDLVTIVLEKCSPKINEEGNSKPGTKKISKEQRFQQKMNSKVRESAKAKKQEREPRLYPLTRSIRLCLPETLFTKCTRGGFQMFETGDAVFVTNGPHRCTRGRFVHMFYPSSDYGLNGNKICTICPDDSDDTIDVPLRMLYKPVDREKSWLGNFLSVTAKVSFSDGTVLSKVGRLAVLKEELSEAAEKKPCDVLYVKAQMIRHEFCKTILQRRRFNMGARNWHPICDFGPLPDCWVASAAFVSEHWRTLEHALPEILAEMTAIYRAVLTVFGRKDIHLLRGRDGWALKVTRDAGAMGELWGVARSLDLQRAALCLPKDLYHPSTISSRIDLKRRDIPNPQNGWFKHDFPGGWFQ